MREVPPQLLDPYRVEGLLHTLDPGAVLILGNSTAEESFDTELLAEAYAERGLRFEKLTVGGSRMVTFGMLSRGIEKLEPAAIILMYTSASLGSGDLAGRIHAYDVRVAPALFTTLEAIRNPGIHLNGLLRQSHVLARHRSAMQRTAMIEVGWYAWWKLRRDYMRRQLEQIRSGAALRRLFRGLMRGRNRYPNPNTRSVSLLASIARERGIPFVLVEAPPAPTLRLPFLSSARDRLRDHVSGMAEAQGFTFVRAADLLEFDGDDFKDLVHLNEAGREKFTAQFIDILQQIL